MKNSFFLLALCLFIHAAIPAQGLKVPDAVTKAFNTKFPGAASVKWGKENAKEYEAEFKLNGRSASANFLVDGSLVETEMEIANTELPAAVVSAVQTKYPGAVLIKSYKLETAKGVITYEAEIKNGTKKKELIMHADGSIVK